MKEWLLHDPAWLWALLLLPLINWLRGKRGVPVLVVPFAAQWYRPVLSAFSRLPETLAYIGLVFVILGLARPQRLRDEIQTKKEGYDLVLVIDLSKSMWAEDFERNGRRINRLEAIRPVIEAFIQKRPDDRIGMVVFSGRAYTLAPLTFDHDWLLRQTQRLRIGMVEDGTAIGDGLAVALTRLSQRNREENLKRKGAFIILLTDGANNKGAIAPLQAAELARKRGVPVYTIGAGQEGIIPMPFFDGMGNLLGLRPGKSDLDEPTLRAIAQMTGGSYYRAYDAGTINNAFTEIDRARKIEFQSNAFRLTDEYFMWFSGIGFFCFLSAVGILVWKDREKTSREVTV